MKIVNDNQQYARVSKIEKRFSEQYNRHYYRFVTELGNGREVSCCISPKRYEEEFVNQFKEGDFVLIDFYVKNGFLTISEVDKVY